MIRSIARGTIALLLLSGVEASAQSESTVTPLPADSAQVPAVQASACCPNVWNVYCEIYRSGMGHLGVNFGSNATDYDWPWANDIVDPQTGRRLQFNNIIDGLNYMSRRGWKLVQTYTTVDATANGRPDSDVHWVLTKQVRSEADILNGLMTKKAYKAQRK